MKAYLLYSKELDNNILQVLTTQLEKLGCKIVPRKQIREDIGTIDFEEAKQVFQTNEKSIRNCDIVIAECSYHSSSLGYQISKAIEEKKPLIALYNLSDELKDSPRKLKKVPLTLKGNPSKYFILKEYHLNSIQKTLELAVKDAKSLADTKFILIIPPQIDKYLEWNVKEKGISKAEITRQAVERMMHEDKAYMDYMKSFSDTEASNS